MKENATAEVLNESDILAEAQASAGTFGGAGVFYLASIILYYCRIVAYERLNERWKWRQICSVHGQGVLIAVGGLCYYIGDNLPPLIREHRKGLGCDAECAEGVQIFGIVTLGTATITYLPVLIDVLPRNREKYIHVETNTEEGHMLLLEEGQTAPEKTTEEETPAHAVVFLLLAKTTNLNLVYTAIERLVANHCNNRVTGGVWAYFIVYFIAFLCLSLYKMWNYNGSEESNEGTQRKEHNGSEEPNGRTQREEHIGSEEPNGGTQREEHIGSEEPNGGTQREEHNGSEEPNGGTQRKEHNGSETLQ